MKPFRQHPPLTMATAGLACSGFIALAIVLMPSWVRLSEYDAATILPPRLLFPETVRQGSFKDFAAIVDRSLFNFDRRKDPVPQALGAGKPQLPSLDGYRLVGVIVTADQGVALVERRATNSVVKLKAGDNLDGRTVKDITAAGVTFSGSSAIEILSIPKAAGVHFTSTAAQKTGESDSNTMQNGTATGDRDKN